MRVLVQRCDALVAGSARSPRSMDVDEVLAAVRERMYGRRRAVASPRFPARSFTSSCPGQATEQEFSIIVRAVSENTSCDIARRELGPDNTRCAACGRPALIPVFQLPGRTRCSSRLRAPTMKDSPPFPRRRELRNRLRSDGFVRLIVGGPTYSRRCCWSSGVVVFLQTWRGAIPLWPCRSPHRCWRRAGRITIIHVLFSWCWPQASWFDGIVVEHRRKIEQGLNPQRRRLLESRGIISSHWCCARCSFR